VPHVARIELMIMAKQEHRRLIAALVAFYDLLRAIAQGVACAATWMVDAHKRGLARIRIAQDHISLDVAEIGPIMPGIAHDGLAIAANVDAFGLGVPTFVIGAGHRQDRQRRARMTTSQQTTLGVEPDRLQVIAIEPFLCVDPIAGIEDGLSPGALSLAHKILTRIPARIFRGRMKIADRPETERVIGTTDQLP